MLQMNFLMNWNKMCRQIKADDKVCRLLQEQQKKFLDFK